MKSIIKFLVIIWASTISLILPLSSFAESTPNVVVTLKPLHSLVTSIMHGIATPKLLIKHSQSLHHYTLRPSERRLLSKADLIVWVGPELEMFLPRVIENHSTQATSVALINTKNLVLLKNNTKRSHHEHQHGNIDPHIWLSPNNAILISDEITQQLITIDPTNEKQYKKNNQILKNKIKIFSTTIEQQLVNSKQPYVTYHNAIAYLEHEFNLNNRGSVQTNTESQPSAKHLKSLIQIINRDNVHCMFYNQPQKPRLMSSLQNQTQAVATPLDPTGITVEASENAWFEILGNVTKNLNGCLLK